MNDASFDTARKVFRELWRLSTLSGMDVLLLLLLGHVHLSSSVGASFPGVLPDSLQFFEYGSFSVSCELFSGSTEWRVVRKLNKGSTNPSSWNSSAASFSFSLTMEKHSGEYWCEDAAGNTSGAVHISISAGSVILEVPARPVLEGHDVVLPCKNQNSQSKHIADFYKDGSMLQTSYRNNFIIRNVSRSDAGLYRCSISGVGASPESRLTVSTQSTVSSFQEDTPSSAPPSPAPPSLLWTVGGASVALLLMVMGLLLCRKHKVLVCVSCGAAEGSAGDQTGSGGDPASATYAVVNKATKSRSADEGDVYSIVHYRSDGGVS
ncbi:high affinity immunoglobulin gamma Fc receptor I-like isoform X2 [Cottoperca gobio]|uniref:high affinity immunoglobulin gamma Fc receptor I-like isoform X2 n=1 Tax=Cottoperca gobio TaxID=56716 RepID=UPI00110D4175|nr:high affinity immunoglobulin gamma Fc receptor I-like isoform X2 [Cottoperca gobio]